MNIDILCELLVFIDVGDLVFLVDIWFSLKEVVELVDIIVMCEMFQIKYVDVFKGDECWCVVEVIDSEIYDWLLSLIYIQNLLYFQDMFVEKGMLYDIYDVCVLVIFGDMIIIDYISFVGFFKLIIFVGIYLIEWQVVFKDFNSYGLCCGNYEVMMCGIFVNICIKNEMLDGVEGGYIKGLDGGQILIYDVVMVYKDVGVLLVIFGGMEYGVGLLCDWVVKGINLLGVKVVIVEFFEWIYCLNLVGMGVVLFEFMGGDICILLGLKGDEVVIIEGFEGDFKLLLVVFCIIIYGDGMQKMIQLKVCVDIEVEIEYLENGGVLYYVLCNLVKF